MATSLLPSLKFARALLVFLGVCACSLFFNAGRSSQPSSQRVLIVLHSILLLQWMRIGNLGKSGG